MRESCIGKNLNAVWVMGFGFSAGLFNEGRILEGFLCVGMWMKILIFFNANF